MFGEYQNIMFLLSRIDQNDPLQEKRKLSFGKHSQLINMNLLKDVIIEGI